MFVLKEGEEEVVEVKEEGMEKGRGIVAAEAGTAERGKIYIMVNSGCPAIVGTRYSLILKCL